MIEATKKAEGARAPYFADVNEIDGLRAGSSWLERRLIDRVLVGDVDAFCDLVQPHEGSIYRRALSILRNEADAEEVVQESILKAFRNLCQFQSRSRFSTWLNQIVINEARLKLRKDRRYLYESLECGRSASDGRASAKGLLRCSETPLDCLEKKELNAAVSRSVNLLPSKYRSVLILRELQGLSTVDTAKTLGISEMSVKIRLWRARGQLRDALAACR